MSALARASLALVLVVAWGIAPILVQAQESIKILTVTSPETRALRVVAQEFTRKTGIPVQFTEQGRLGYFESVITQLVAGTTAFDRERAGGGAWIDEGVHQADLLRWFLGDPTSVAALPGRLNLEWGVEEAACALFAFPSGVTATVEVGWTFRAAGPSTEILGDRGSIVQAFTDRASVAVPLPTAAHLRLYRADAPDRGWVDLGSSHDPATILERVPLAFVECLTSGAPPPSTLDDGMAALEMIAGAYQAAAQGRVVRFPLPGGVLHPATG